MADKKDWRAWHTHYDEPDSELARRLATVQQEIGNCLPRDLDKKFQIIDICAGNGRDLIPVLGRYPRSSLVHSRLVEIDQVLVDEARAAAQAIDLRNLEFVVGDAALYSRYEDVLPADLIMLCGVFGNISDEDLKNTIKALPGFCKQGTKVIWTRSRKAPDVTPVVRDLFEECGFREVKFVAPDNTVYAVGTNEFVGMPRKYSGKCDKLFTFIR